MKSAFIAAALLLAAAPAFAQAPAAPADPAAPAAAPIPQEGRLIQPGAGTPIEAQIPTGGLPGVGMDAEAPEDENVTGPGGLANGVGAIGTNTPSTSSANPVPFEPSASDRFGIPLTPPAAAD